MKPFISRLWLRFELTDVTVASALVQTKVLIVGAGFEGLAAGVALKRAGEHDFLILEKCNSVGGVWRDNRYPGCTCNVPSHLYSFSFAPYTSRSKRYPSQQDILHYLEQVATDHGLQPHIKLETEVTEAHFQQTNANWIVATAHKQQIVATTIVFAVGQLHRPYYPDIPGLSDFGGQVVHSAAWDDSIDLKNRRICIIGSGSSAVQMLPKLAAVSTDVTMFQRTPNWVLPKPASDFGSIERILLRCPGAHRIYRGMLRCGADMLLSPLSRSAVWRCIVERYAKHNLRRHLVDESVVKKLTPSYPIGSKRVILDNDFYQTLGRGQARLVTESITAVNKNGIVTESGDLIKCDVIICATGFKASEFMVPITVTGRDGHVLSEDWAAGAEAFMGLAVNGYPNLFTIAGPNSFNPAGSNPDMKELQIAYLMKCLDWKAQANGQSIEVSPQASARYQDRLRIQLERSVWSGSVDSWYKHRSGKITNPWPESRRSFARQLRQNPMRSFVLSGGEADMIKI